MSGAAAQLPQTRHSCILQHFSMPNGSNAGQTRLLLTRLLLAQHFLACAERLLLQCSASHRSSHSTASIWLEPKLNFRRSSIRQLRRGQSELSHLRLLLAQHWLAFTARRSLQCNGSRQIGHSRALNSHNPKPCFRRRFCYNQTVGNSTLCRGVTSHALEEKRTFKCKERNRSLRLAGREICRDYLVRKVNEIF